MTPHETGAPATRPSLIGPPRWLLSRGASASQECCSPPVLLFLVRLRPGPTGLSTYELRRHPAAPFQADCSFLFCQSSFMRPYLSATEDWSSSSFISPTSQRRAGSPYMDLPMAKPRHMGSEAAAAKLSASSSSAAARPRTSRPAQYGSCSRTTSPILAHTPGSGFGGVFHLGGLTSSS